MVTLDIVWASHATVMDAQSRAEWAIDSQTTLYLLPEEVSGSSIAASAAQYEASCAAFGARPLDCSGFSGAPYNRYAATHSSYCCASDTSSPITQHGWQGATFCQGQNRIYNYNVDLISSSPVRWICAISSGTTPPTILWMQTF